MRRIEFKLRIVLLVVWGFLNSELFADGRDGGQITYRLIDSNTGKYRIRLEAYRDCASIQYGSENINIVKPGFSGAIAINLVSMEEITPISYAPDVIVRATTNCPSGPIGSNGIKGFMKVIFEVDYTVGKNIGWALLGYSTCCRSTGLTTGGANAGVWYQAAINTDYNNSSVEYNTSPMSLWTAGRDNNYAFGAYDRYDPQYININGTYVRRDSIAYQMTVPFQAMANSANDIFNLANTLVTLNAGLSAQNFLYTSGGVNLNQATGVINCNPSQTQTGILAFVTREFRAIPNANGIGYTRTLVGYTMRDVEWGVRPVNYSKDILYSGILTDSSNVESLVNNYTAKTCRIFDNKIVFKIVGAPYDTIKLKENSFIDTSVISNYSLSYYKVTGSFADTIYATLKFNKKKNITLYNFLYKAFYTNSVGYQIERYIPIRVLFEGSYYSLNQDSASYCIGNSPVRLSNPMNTKVSWTPKTNIVAAQSPDSAWIDVNPTASRWYYVNNLNQNQGCKINDSIFVSVDTCSTISGYLFIDSNKNCVKDAVEAILPNTVLKIQGTANSYYQEVITNSSGYYSFEPPINSSLSISSDNKLFNCSSFKTYYPMTMGATSIVKDLPIKDSVLLSVFSNVKCDTIACSKKPISFQYSFTKTLGSLKSVIKYGNGDSTTINYPIAENTISENRTYTYLASGVYPLKVYFYGKGNKLITILSLQTIKAGNCITGQVMYDMNGNCAQDSTDQSYANAKVYYKNLSNSQVNVATTNANGSFQILFQPTAGYEFYTDKPLICADSGNKKKIPSFANDTNLSINLNIDPISQFYAYTDNSTYSDCSSDTQVVYMTFQKPYGYMKAKLYYDNDSLIDTLGPNYGSYIYTKKFRMLKNGSFAVRLKFETMNGTILRSDTIALLRLSSCIRLRLFADRDSNCMLNLPTDLELNYKKVTVKNVSSGKTSYYFSNRFGYVSIKLDTPAACDLSFDDTMYCPTKRTTMRVSAMSMDSAVFLQVPFKKPTVIIVTAPEGSGRTVVGYSDGCAPKISISLAGRVSNSSTLKFNIIRHTADTAMIVQIYLDKKAQFIQGSQTNMPDYSYYSNLMDIRKLRYSSSFKMQFDSIRSNEHLRVIVNLYPSPGYNDDCANNEIIIYIATETSYDPNNKTASILSEEKNGDFTNKNDYINYTINFQNTGTIAARDIYLTDVIDTKLDLASFQVLGFSDSLKINMDDNRNLRFDYKNIMLPDSATNEPESHGFVHFMIRPKADLNLGETISNEANIYFDYNPPILTNTALNKYILKSADTSSGGGGTGGGGGKDSTLAVNPSSNAPIQIYPNPASAQLYIDKGSSTASYQIRIHSLDGKCVYVGRNPKTIDVSRWERGVYFLHYTSEKERLVQKIQLD